jgi:hypothetical protein
LRFKLVTEIKPTGSFEFAGQAVPFSAGQSVASALLCAGIVTCRTTLLSNAPRAPYCMMGVCFECAVFVEGVGVRQACMLPAVAGMKVRPEGNAK